MTESVSDFIIDSMKRLTRFILPFSFSLTVVTPFAQITTPSSASFESITTAPTVLEIQTFELEKARSRLKERREAIRLEIEERSETRAQLTERKRERIRLFFGRTTRRIQTAIDRLERLINRIESRLNKIEASDTEIDTSTIREAVDEAKDKLVETSAALSQAKTSLEDILNAENVKTAFADLRDLIKEIKEQLKKTHQLLVQIIGEIKGLRVGQEKRE